MENQIDNSHFKPINEGLGFHHSQKFSKNKQKEITRSFTSDPTTLDLDRIPVALSPFYASNDSTREMGLNDYKTFDDFEEEESFSIASSSKRLAAWFIDTAAVVVIFMSIVLIISLANSFSLSQLGNIFLAAPMRWIFLFCLLNMFYFTLLEKSTQSTLGKSLMGLFVRTSDESRLSLDHTLVRSLVGLGNIVTLGFLALFGFQDKISETQVLER